MKLRKRSETEGEREEGVRNIEKRQERDGREEKERGKREKVDKPFTKPRTPQLKSLR